MADRNAALNSVEERTGTLFLVTGGLFAVFAGLHGVEAFMDRSAPMDVFGPAGFVFAFLGMLGLYPNLVHRTPWLTRFGAVFATIGLIASAVTSVWHIGLWLIPAATPAFVAAIPAGMVLGQFLGYVPFGLASLRADVSPRIVGLSLLAVPSILAVMIVTVATGYATSGSAVVLGGAQALLHVAVGNSLRTDGISSDRTERSGEPTAK